MLERCVGGTGAHVHMHTHMHMHMHMQHARVCVCVLTYQPGQRWRENWASMAFCRTMVNLWKGNLAIASRSNSSRNSMTVPERCSCISSFCSPFALVLDELMRVHLPVGGGGVMTVTNAAREVTRRGAGWGSRASLT